MKDALNAKRTKFLLHQVKVTAKILISKSFQQKNAAKWLRLSEIPNLRQVELPDTKVAFNF